MKQNIQFLWLTVGIGYVILRIVASESVSWKTEKQILRQLSSETFAKVIIIWESVSAFPAFWLNIGI